LRVSMVRPHIPEKLYQQYRACAALVGRLHMKAMRRDAAAIVQGLPGHRGLQRRTGGHSPVRQALAMAGRARGSVRTGTRLRRGHAAGDLPLAITCRS
jgi:hypothetical protein